MPVVAGCGPDEGAGQAASLWVSTAHSLEPRVQRTSSGKTAWTPTLFMGMIKQVRPLGTHHKTEGSQLADLRFFLAPFLKEFGGTC